MQQLLPSIYNGTHNHAAGVSFSNSKIYKLKKSEECIAIKMKLQHLWISNMLHTAWLYLYKIQNMRKAKLELAKFHGPEMKE